MRVTINDIGGTVAKEDERYVVKATSGHSHPGQEEVYYFIEGIGKMELGNDTIKVQPGDVVLIEDGVFHRVHAGMYEEMYFVCVFDGKRNHK